MFDEVRDSLRSPNLEIDVVNLDRTIQIISSFDDLGFVYSRNLETDAINLDQTIQNLSLLMTQVL